MHYVVHLHPVDVKQRGREAVYLIGCFAGFPSMLRRFLQVERIPAAAEALPLPSQPPLLLLSSVSPTERGDACDEGDGGKEIDSVLFRQTEVLSPSNKRVDGDRGNHVEIIR